MNQGFNKTVSLRSARRRPTPPRHATPPPPSRHPGLPNLGLELENPLSKEELERALGGGPRVPYGVLQEPRINGIPQGSRLDQLAAALVGTVRVLWSETSFRSVATFYFDLNRPMTYGRFMSGSFVINVERKGSIRQAKPVQDMVWTGSDLTFAHNSHRVLFVQTELDKDLLELLKNGSVKELKVKMHGVTYRVLSASETGPIFPPDPKPEPKPASVPAPAPKTVSVHPEPAASAAPVPEPVPAPASVPAPAPAPSKPPPKIVVSDDHYADSTI